MAVHVLLINLFLFFLELNPEKITIKLTNCETHKPVSYATIDFQQVDSGTYSDEQGLFTIPVSLDSIRISALGYASKVITKSKWVNMIRDTLILCLTPVAYDFEQVTVEAKLLDENVLGYDLLPMPLNRIRYASWSGFGSVVAIRLDFPERYSVNYIQELAIALYENPFDSTLFRFRILTVGDDGRPDKDVYQSPLIVGKDKTERWIRFDLAEKWIPIRERSVFFVVENFMPKEESFSFMKPKFSFLFHSRKEPKTPVLVSNEGFHKWLYSRKQVVYQVKYFGEK